MSTQVNLDNQADDLRAALVADLVQQGAIRSEEVLDAFSAVPRHLFVPGVDVSTAYSNQPVFIRWDDDVPISSSTQPLMMAIMIEQLDLREGHRVLEVGAGTGYNAAIMAEIVGAEGSIVSLDIDQDIVDEAAGNLSDTGYGNVRAVCGDGFEGFPPEAPYDRIIATVGAHDVSPHWVEQLVDGGIMVVPLWFKGFCLSVALEKRMDGLHGRSASPCTFIPIRGGWRRGEGYYPVGDPTGEGLRMAIGLDWDDESFRQDLSRLFNQGARLHEIGRSLEGQFFGQDIYSGLFMFLTASPDVYNVYSSSDVGPFQGPGYVLIDREGMSAAVLSERFPEQVLVYGNTTAFGKLTELLDRWDRAKHPSIGDLRIRGLFSVPHALAEGEWVVAKQSTYAWVMSWGDR